MPIISLHCPSPKIFVITYGRGLSPFSAYLTLVRYPILWLVRIAFPNSLHGHERFEAPGAGWHLRFLRIWRRRLCVRFSLPRSIAQQLQKLRLGHASWIDPAGSRIRLELRRFLVVEFNRQLSHGGSLVGCLNS
jgi:hypothetical protein